MNQTTRIQREVLALAAAAVIMTLKVVLMVALLRRWKVRNEPDV
jgi:hypothetical protein